MIGSVSLICPMVGCSEIGLASKAADAVAGAGGKSVAHAAAQSIFSALAAWLDDGAAWLVRHVLDDLAAPTQIRLNGAWFLAEEHDMAKVALLVVLPMLLAATIGAVLRQDGRRLARIWGVGVPVAGIGTMLAVVLTERAVTVVNALCAAIAGPAPYRPFLLLARPFATPGVPAMVTALFGCLVAVGAVLLWLELVVRSVSVSVAVFFLPLGLASYVWPATAVVTKRFLEILTVLIASKFVIVATLVLGAAALRSGGGGIDTGVIGAAILLMAAFTPFAVLRLAPIVETAAVAHLEGMSRRPLRAASAAMPLAGDAFGGAASLVGRLGRGGEPDLGGSVAATGIPTHQGDYDPDHPPPSPGPASGPAVGSDGPGSPPAGGGAAPTGAAGGVSGEAPSSGATRGGAPPAGATRAGAPPAGAPPASEAERSPAPGGGSTVDTDPADDLGLTSIPVLSRLIPPPSGEVDHGDG